MTDESSKWADRARLRIKLGAAEIEFEGREGFWKEEIAPTVVAKVVELVEARTELQRAPDAKLIEPIQPENGGEAVAPANRLDHSMRNTAMLLNAKSGRDLMIAGAAFLTLVKAQERFSRNDLHDAMKEATGFYKKSDANNFSKTLQSLVRSGALRESHDGTYALTPSWRQDLENQIADAG